MNELASESTGASASEPALGELSVEDAVAIEELAGEPIPVVSGVKQAHLYHSSTPIELKTLDGGMLLRGPERLGVSTGPGEPDALVLLGEKAVARLF